MLNFNKAKKAFTLIELSIVIALVSIIGTAVISLCVFISNTAHKNSTQLAFMQEVNLAQSLVQKFADNTFNHDKLFDFEEKHNVLLDELAVFEDGVFSINYGKYSFDTIESMTFSVKTTQRADIKDFLIICTLNLKGKYTTNGSDTFTFAVNSYVGEVAPNA